MIVVLDVETTGLKPESDRIVQVALGAYDLGSKTVHDPINHVDGFFTTLVNPEEPIPPETTDIHGITDDMVSEAPCFADLASDLRSAIGDHPVLAYNARFDMGFLHQEFVRAHTRGFSFDHPVIDPYHIERQLLGHDLSSVYRRYMNQPLEDAHDAQADAQAALDVFVAQQDRHGARWNGVLPTMPVIREAFDLDSFSLDLFGKFQVVNGEVRFAFGKHKGKRAADHPRYLDWMIKTSTFPEPVRSIARELRETGEVVL